MSDTFETPASSDYQHALVGGEQPAATWFMASIQPEMGPVVNAGKPPVVVVVIDYLFFIGIFLVLLGCFMQSLGLNLQRRSFLSLSAREEAYLEAEEEVEEELENGSDRPITTEDVRGRSQTVPPVNRRQRPDSAISLHRRAKRSEPARPLRLHTNDDVSTAVLEEVQVKRKHARTKRSKEPGAKTTKSRGKERDEGKDGERITPATENVTLASSSTAPTIVTCPSPALSSAASPTDLVNNAPLVTSSAISTSSDGKVKMNRKETILWYTGFILYILSQVIGSLAPLGFISTIIIAPMGAFTIIFNAWIAKFLFNELFGIKEAISTLVVTIGAAMVAFFGYVPEPKSGYKLEELLYLYTTRSAKVYFPLIAAALVFLFILRLWFIRVIRLRMMQRSRRSSHATSSPTRDHVEESGDTDRLLPSPTHSVHPFRNERAPFFMLSGLSDNNLVVTLGSVEITMAAILASLTLILAKSGVELIVTSIRDTNQFGHFASWLIIAALISIGALQVWFLNHGLKRLDAVLVVPVFFCGYNIFSLLASIAYFDHWCNFDLAKSIMILVGIFVLLAGVVGLTYQPVTADNDDTTAESTLTRPRSTSFVRVQMGNTMQPGVGRSPATSRRHSSSERLLHVNSQLCSFNLRPDSVLYSIDSAEARSTAASPSSSRRVSFRHSSGDLVNN